MSKPGNQNHRKRYERYKNQGRKDANKKLRQERDEKRRAKFAKRREEGKTYEYTPNPYKKDSADYVHEALIRHEKTLSKKGEFQRTTSVMRKLQNELDKIAKAEKAAMDRTNRRERSRQSPRYNNNDDEE